MRVYKICGFCSKDLFNFIVPVFSRRVLPVKNRYDHTHLPVKMEAAEPTRSLTANLTSVRVRPTVPLQKNKVFVEG